MRKDANLKDIDGDAVYISLYIFSCDSYVRQVVSLSETTGPRILNGQRFFFFSFVRPGAYPV